MYEALQYLSHWLTTQNIDPDDIIFCVVAKDERIRNDVAAAVRRQFEDNGAHLVTESLSCGKYKGQICDLRFQLEPLPEMVDG